MPANKDVSLLISGFINQNVDIFIPSSIILLVDSFYTNEYFIDFNWSIKGKNMKRFVEAKTGDILSPESLFNIQDVTIKCMVYPNGRKARDNGRVQFGINILHIPPNIKCIGCYLEFKCTTVGYVNKRFYKITKKTSTGSYMMSLSHYKQFTQVNFGVIIDILYIKYKYNLDKCVSDRMNYIKPLKVNQMAVNTWNINGLLMDKCKNIKHGEYIFSETFDNDWCCAFTVLIPSDLVAIGYRFLSMPFGIKSIDVKFKICVNGDINAKIDECIQTVQQPHWALIWRKKTFSFTEFKAKKSVSIHIKLEIVKLFDDNGVSIAAKCWSKYGIICNKQ